MSDLDLCYLSASEALSRFRARSLSPVELLEALIARAETVEPAIKAIAWSHTDEALEKARKAEARYQRTDGRLRRLEGLPLAVKEDTAIKGRRLSFGSLIYRDNIADHTNPSVERLLGAGAILHAQTTCPEFMWPWTCTSRLHGVTRNPWNLEVTCGASSGGSAAALAAGTTILATGTDSAGSIRMPAGMCGVVGYKPPYGRNPESPETTFDSFNHIGPMTRTVADAALMQNIMSGHHPQDHASLRQRVTLPAALAGIEGLKLAYSIDLETHEVDRAVRANTLAALDRLRAAGASVEEVATPWAPELFAKASRWGNLIYADRFADAVNQHPHLVCDATKVTAAETAKTTPRMFHDLLKTAGRAWAEFGPLLERYDAFLVPTVASAAIPAEASETEASVPVNDSFYEPHDVVMTFYFDVFSRCPALAVPTGFAPNGVPTGLEVVGRTYDDLGAFRVAAALERDAGLFAPERRPKL